MPTKLEAGRMTRSVIRSGIADEVIGRRYPARGGTDFAPVTTSVSSQSQSHRE